MYFHFFAIVITVLPVATEIKLSATGICELDPVSDGCVASGYKGVTVRRDKRNSIHS